jgi:hypothetical protein
MVRVPGSVEPVPAAFDTTAVVHLEPGARAETDRVETDAIGLRRSSRGDEKLIPDQRSWVPTVQIGDVR